MYAGTHPLEGPGPAPLVPGELYTMPLVPLHGCVVVPGEILPHRLVAPSDRVAVRAALAAPAPVNRLFTVVCAGDISEDELDLLRFHTIGVTVEVMRASRESVNVMCRARQRVRLELEISPHPLSLLKVAVRVLSEPPPPRLPPGTALPPFLARHLSPEHLAAAACEQFENLIGEWPCPDDSGVDALSYWLVGNLPLDTYQRQALLEAPSAVDRIYQAMQWAGRATGVHCRRCHGRLAPLNALMHLGAHPFGGHYVNNNGVVHDMLTVENASVIRVVGYPEASHSWFENFAWQVVYCRRCGIHVGWKFTTVHESEGEDEVPEQRFFGLRRSALTCCSDVEEGVEGAAAVAAEGVEEEGEGYSEEEWDVAEGEDVDLGDELAPWEVVAFEGDTNESAGDGEEGW